MPPELPAQSQLLRQDPQLLQQVQLLQQQNQEVRQQLQSLQQQQNEQQQQQQLQSDDQTRGYMMKADNGSFTVKQAWDEYYGPIALAKQQDAKWPFTPARKKAYRRRHLFMEMIANKAKYEGRDVMEVVDSFDENEHG